MTSPVAIRSDVPLAPFTTLELGGPARRFVEAHDVDAVRDAAAFARAHGLPTVALGGGSNVVVADAGVEALVLRVGLRGVETRYEGDAALVTAAAGEPWDELVGRTVDEGLAGIECLSGIPGLVGATPIQNVGAYGQEVAETIQSVRVLETSTGEIVDLWNEDCGFRYRDSALKRRPHDVVVLSVTFALQIDGAPRPRYPELERALAVRDAAPALRDVREAVLALRRSKSMLVEPSDPNRRSVGSFFTNPIVSDAQAREVIARAVTRGVVPSEAAVPRWGAGEGLVKLAAGWLVERAGFSRGYREGAVGISSGHALALVHHGGGSAAELLALARRVRDAVRATFGVELHPEPTILGAAWEPAGATAR